MATRAARGRLAQSHAVRDLLATTLGPLPAGLGNAAGTNVPHAPAELTVGLGASQCAACFGWRDDPRHVYPASG